MQKNFPDYVMPTFPAVDATTSIQKLQDLASATKVFYYYLFIVYGWPNIKLNM
jgi:hypothetical protein